MGRSHEIRRICSRQFTSTPLIQRFLLSFHRRTPLSLAMRKVAFFVGLSTLWAPIPGARSADQPKTPGPCSKAPIPVQETALRLWDCAPETPPQTWAVGQGGAAGEPTLQAHGLCVDTLGYSTLPGSCVFVDKCHSSDRSPAHQNQGWVINNVCPAPPFPRSIPCPADLHWHSRCSPRCGMACDRGKMSDGVYFRSLMQNVV